MQHKGQTTRRWRESAATRNKHGGAKISRTWARSAPAKTGRGRREASCQATRCAQSGQGDPHDVRQELSGGLYMRAPVSITLAARVVVPGLHLRDLDANILALRGLKPERFPHPCARQLHRVARRPPCGTPSPRQGSRTLTPGPSRTNLTGLPPERQPPTILCRCKVLWRGPSLVSLLNFGQQVWLAQTTIACPRLLCLATTQHMFAIARTHAPMRSRGHPPFRDTCGLTFGGAGSMNAITVPGSDRKRDNKPTRTDQDPTPHCVPALPPKKVNCLKPCASTCQHRFPCEGP